MTAPPPIQERRLPMTREHETREYEREVDATYEVWRVRIVAGDISVDDLSHGDNEVVIDFGGLRSCAKCRESLVPDQMFDAARAVIDARAGVDA